MTKKGKKAAKKAASRARTGPGASAVRYNGPLLPDAKGDDLYMTSIATTQQLSIVLTTGAGSTQTVFSTSGISALPQFGAFANDYEEWRPLAVDVSFFPVSQGFSPALSIQTGMNAIITPLWMVGWHEDSTPIGAQAVAPNIGGHKVASITQKLRAFARMSETDEAEWAVTTAGPSHNMGVSIYVGAAGMTTGGSSLALGTFRINYVVQFRKRRSYTATLASRAMEALVDFERAESKEEDVESKSKRGVPSGGELVSATESLRPPMFQLRPELPRPPAPVDVEVRPPMAMPSRSQQAAMDDFVLVHKTQLNRDRLVFTKDHILVPE